MKEVIIYTTKTCPFCVRAKRLLGEKGVEYLELRVDKNPELAIEAKEKSGGRMTVPQIFIGDYHVGGCDDLYALEKENRLDQLLEG
jgi:glutaredoxin 3